MTAFVTHCWMGAWRFFIFSLRVETTDFSTCCFYVSDGFIWKVWLSGGEVSLVFQTGSVEWKCCEWQRSVSLTQSRHASPSHRLAQKLRVTVPRKTKGRGRQKSVRHSAFCWTIDVSHDSRACVRVCVRSVASSKLSHFLYLFCGSIQLACCLLSSPHWFFLYKFRMLHVCKLTKMFLFAFIQVE